MQKIQVQSLGGEDPLEEEMATHASILAWRIPWTGEPGGLQCMGSQRVRHDCTTEHTHTHMCKYSIKCLLNCNLFQSSIIISLSECEGSLALWPN